MTFGTLTLLAPLAAGATPPAAPCPPGGPGCPPAYTAAGMPPGPLPLRPAPVLAAKVIAPPGVRVTAFPGSPLAKVYAAPAVFGFRPGYVYRFELAGLPNRPDAVLYPEFEVRGSLVPRPTMNYMDYPVPVVFTETDLDRAASGALVTKVIALEDPTKAVPVQTTPDRPLELPAANDEEALNAAAESGRVVMIARLGNRQPTAEQLARWAIPGTVLLPGEKHLGLPAAPPPLAWCGIPLFDPILGPKFPVEECLTDGGDTGPRLGIGPVGRLGGLNPTDVAAEYTVAGRRKLTTTNPVCVCVPRFTVQRVEVAAGGVQLALRLEAGVQRVGAAGILERVRTDAVAGRVKPVGFDTSLRAAAQVGRQGVHSLLGYVGPAKAVAVSQGVRIVVSSVEPEETANACGFVVTKAVDPKDGVKIGDEVTFTLKYTNGTRDPVTDLVLSDSLSPRLEYVPGSAKADRPVNVTTEANEVGSLVVRFEVPGTVQPGQGGMVTFKARVR